MKKKILLIEICNFTDYPIGGYLSFAKQMLTAFGNQLALVGLGDDETPIGKWSKKKINGIDYDYFAVVKIQKTNKRPLIPYRLMSYLAIKKYRKEILSIEIDNVFIQTPEVLFALRKSALVNLCCRIPGVGNPMTHSRYWYGKLFANIFDFYFFKELRKANVILATADKQSIIDFVGRGNGKLSIEKVIQFPTRVNTKIFKPLNKINERLELKLTEYDKIVVTTGRISEIKGWKFMLDAFVQYKTIYQNSLFVFLGDGEDRIKVESYISKLGIEDSVLITGRITHDILSKYLNAADIYIMGSYLEGWATSLVEAISCAKPIVCTNFSSAKDLVDTGVNGFVIDNRNVDLFVDAMIKCDNIDFEKLFQQSIKMQEYGVSGLKEKIIKLWKLN